MRRMKIEAGVAPADIAHGMLADDEGSSLLLREYAKRKGEGGRANLLHWFRCGYTPQDERDALRRLGELLIKASK